MKAEKKVRKKTSDEKKALISFLKATRDGKYAKIEESSLPYSRIIEKTIVVEDEYYYSFR